MLSFNVNFSFFSFYLKDIITNNSVTRVKDVNKDYHVTNPKIPLIIFAENTSTVADKSIFYKDSYLILA